MTRDLQREFSNRDLKHATRGQRVVLRLLLYCCLIDLIPALEFGSDYVEELFFSLFFQSCN
jgi:hypothetical protein